MAIEFADSGSELATRRDLSTRSIVRATPFASVASVLNRLWAHADCRLGGQIVEAGQTITAATSLDDVTAAGTLDRYVGVDRDKLAITAALYGSDVELTVVVKNAATGSTVATITVTASSTATTFRASETIAIADTTDDGTTGGDPALLYCEASIDTTGASGEYYGYAAYAEDVADQTRVPGGGAEPLIWLDSSDADTLYTDTSGTTPAGIDDDVAAWECLGSRGGLYTQSNAGNRPTRKADGLAWSDGDYMAGAKITDFGSELYVVAVATFDSWSSDGAFIIAQFGGYSRGAFFLGAGDSSPHKAQFTTITDGGNRVNTFGDTTVSADSSTVMISGLYEGSIASVRLDGVEDGSDPQSGDIQTGGTTNTGTENLHLGKYFNNSKRNLRGKIKEIRIYTASDMPDVSEVEAELASKWSVS